MLRISLVRGLSKVQVRVGIMQYAPSRVSLEKRDPTRSGYRSAVYLKPTHEYAQGVNAAWGKQNQIRFPAKLRALGRKYDFLEKV